MNPHRFFSLVLPAAILVINPGAARLALARVTVPSAPGLPLTAADLSALVLATASGTTTQPTDGDYSPAGVTGIFNGNV